MNKRKRFGERIAELFFPPKCLGCGEAVVSSRIKLCASCSKQFYGESKVICPVCGRVASGCQCRVTYLKREVFPEIRLVSTRLYSPDPNEADLRMTRNLILRSKDVCSPQTAELFAVELGFCLRELLRQNGEELKGWVVTYPPRSMKNLLKMGFDHGEILAEELARVLEIECRKTLLRNSSKKQKELDSKERLGNASEAFSVIPGSVSRGEKFILVDDVITTGATMAAAADLLYQNGAAIVVPTAAARTVCRDLRGNYA